MMLYEPFGLMQGLRLCYCFCVQDSSVKSSQWVVHHPCPSRPWRTIMRRLS